MAASLPDSLVELEAVDTDTWQNIPLPVKTSIAVVCRHLLTLTKSHISLESTLKTSNEALSNRLKKTAKALNSQIDLLMSSQKRHSDDQEVLSRRLEAVSAKLREDVSTSIESEKKDREKYHKASEERLAEAVGKLNGLQTQLLASERELKADIGNLKALTRYEIEEMVVKPEIQTINESVEEVLLAVKKMDKQLGAKIEALEDFQQRHIQAKLEIYEKSLETALTAINNPHKTSQLSAEKLSEAIQIALKPLKTDIEVLQTELNTHKSQNTQEITQFQSKLDTISSEIDAKIASNASNLYTNFTTAHTSLLNHMSQTKQDLVYMINDKEKSLLSDQFASLAGLEQRVSKQLEDYVDREMGEMRGKLAVSLLCSGCL
jgi:DNA repair exonuclease SbcCD ATPase subunit